MRVKKNYHSLIYNETQILIKTKLNDFQQAYPIIEHKYLLTIRPLYLGLDSQFYFELLPGQNFLNLTVQLILPNQMILSVDGFYFDQSSYITEILYETIVQVQEKLFSTTSKLAIQAEETNHIFYNSYQLFKIFSFTSVITNAFQPIAQLSLLNYTQPINSFNFQNILGTWVFKSVPNWLHYPPQNYTVLEYRINEYLPSQYYGKENFAIFDVRQITIYSFFNTMQYNFVLIILLLTLMFRKINRYIHRDNLEYYLNLEVDVQEISRQNEWEKCAYYNKLQLQFESQDSFINSTIILIYLLIEGQYVLYSNSAIFTIMTQSHLDQGIYGILSIGQAYLFVVYQGLFLAHQLNMIREFKKQSAEIQIQRSDVSQNYGIDWIGLQKKLYEEYYLKKTYLLNDIKVDDNAYYKLLSCLYKIMFSLIIVIGYSHVQIQFLALFALTLIRLIYLVFKKPYTIKHLNILFGFADFVFLIILFMKFGEFKLFEQIQVSSGDEENANRLLQMWMNFGWATCAFLTLYTILHLGIFFVRVYYEIKSKIEKRKIEKAENKIKKEKARSNQIIDAEVEAYHEEMNLSQRYCQFQPMNAPQINDSVELFYFMSSILTNYSAPLNAKFTIQFSYSHLQKKNYIINNQSCSNLSIEIDFINKSFSAFEIHPQNVFFWERNQRSEKSLQKFSVPPNNSHRIQYSRLLGPNDEALLSLKFKYFDLYEKKSEVFSFNFDMSRLKLIMIDSINHHEVSRFEQTKRFYVLISQQLLRVPNVQIFYWLMSLMKVMTEKPDQFTMVLTQRFYFRIDETSQQRYYLQFTLNQQDDGRSQLSIYCQGRPQTKLMNDLVSKIQEILLF